MPALATTPALPRQPLAVGVLMALVAAVGFSAKAILVKLAYRHGVDAVTLLALRMVFAVPIFLAAAVWSVTRNHATRVALRDWGAIVLLGLIGYYLSSLLDFQGLEHISAGLERMILFLYPTLVVLLSAALHRKPLRAREKLALALGYAGIALVFAQDLGSGAHGNVTLGALLVFGSALTYSTYLIGAGPVIQRVGAFRFTAYAMVVASSAVLAQFFLTHPAGALRQPVDVYQLALAMAVFSTVLPVFLLSAAIRRIGSGHTALVGTVGPVSTLFLAAWALAEPITALQLAGSTLVLAGVWLVSRAKG